MAIPDYETCMLPLLVSIADGQLHAIRDVARKIADHFNLSEEERAQVLPSGQQTFISNRVGWAKSYLKKSGLLINPSRGKVQITSEGLKVINEGRSSIDCEFLKRYPDFVEFWTQKPKPTDQGTSADELTTVVSEQTPDEAMETAYTAIRASLADELLELMSECDATFFERLVIDLLLAMGYGGALPEAGIHMGRSGDGGIDGIINEDKLGLDMICIQAKRWKDSVGRPVVQAFAGSMEAHRAKKGVMLTTSKFSSDAHDFVSRIERKIVLIDGQQLAQLMIDHDIGVAGSRTYIVKKVDSDYFQAE